MIALAWAGVAIAGLALAMTALNAATWTRGELGRLEGSVSVLIPARNEAANIEDCVRSALASDHAVTEVLVYDDASTDSTGDLVRALAAEDPRVRVVEGVPLPAGWVGKPHACYRLGEEAVGEVLLFLDADVRLERGGLSRLAGLFGALRADVVTAVPHQVVGTLAERVALPLLHLTYTSWLPLFLIHRSRDPRFLAANGQVLAVRRDAYDAIDGFRGVQAEVVDDMAFCRRAKSAGQRVVFADGEHIARCRMYRSGGEIWRGFSKNVYEGLGHPALLAFVVALYLLGFVLPYAWLAAGVVDPALLVPGSVGVGLNLLLRSLLAARHGHEPVSILAHPVAVIGLVAIAINSWWWSRTGRISWAGRTYPTRAARS